MVSESYHVLTQPAGLVAVGINFALALVNVLTNFLALLGAVDKFAEAAGAVVFSLGVEPPLACSKFPPFFYVQPKHPTDLEDFWIVLTKSLANLLLI